MFLMKKSRYFRGLNNEMLLGMHFLAFLILLLVSSQSASAASSEVSFEEKIGQMLLVGFRGTKPGGKILEDVRQGRVGGVILFDYDVVLKRPERNIRSAAQVTTLIRGLRSAAKIPLLVAVDQEGGKVARLKPKYGFPEFPSAAALGRRGQPEYTQKIAAQVGKMLHSLGFNLNFAPVVDVNVNPDNPVIGKLGRSFSSDAGQVALQAEAFIRGQKSQGVLSCLKHFPGHGSAWNDSHAGMADVTATWTPVELKPYELLINRQACSMIMTAHIFNAELDPEYPATLSKKVITGLLRQQLGFSGVVVSDDLQMKAVADYYGLDEAVRLAISAGVDILLFGNNLSYDPEIPRKVIAMVKAMVVSGEIPRSRIEASYERIMALKKSL